MRALTPHRPATMSSGLWRWARAGDGAMPTSNTSDLSVPEQPETPDVAGAYPRLTDEQMMLLRRFGERKALPKGAALFCEGDRDCDFFVLLDGAAAVVQATDGAPRLIGVHGPGRFL